MNSVGVGIFGSNGHQINKTMIDGQNAFLAGVCHYSGEDLPQDIPVYQTLDEMLKNPKIQLVSICSSLRSHQAQDIQKVIKAGKHVYAEKPCVTDVESLDALLKLADENGVIFCEMAGSVYERPYNKAKEIVDSGVLGQIVQIFVQKSYPYAEWRPQDENVDGGLILQNAIYGIRFIEHIAGETVASVTADETSFGNPKAGNLKMACSLNMTLESGGIASVIANYLNQPGTNVWGNEELRIFGINGYLRTNIQNNTVEVYTKDKAMIYNTEQSKTLFGILIESISLNKPLPLSPYALTRPTRLAIQAKMRCGSSMKF